MLDSEIGSCEHCDFDTFLEYIGEYYSSEAKTTMKKCLHLVNKITAQVNQVKFMNKCKKFSTLPRTHMHTFSNVLQGVHPALIDGLQEKLQRIVLNCKIKSCYIYINSKNRKLLSLMRILNTYVAEDIYEDFAEQLEYNSQNLCNKYKREYVDKFEKITNSAHADYRNEFKPPDKWLKNLSDVQIPKNVANILALGEKFCVKPEFDQNLAIETVAAIES